MTTPSSYPRGTRSGGFTLIELLISISILGVVTGIGINAFVGLTGAWHDTKTLADLDSIADDALNTIQTDVLDVLSFELSGVSIRGEDRATEDQRFFDRILEDDTLVIPVQTTQAGRRRLGGNTVQYHVERNANAQVLRRTVGVLEAEIPQSGRAAVTDEQRANVIRFNVEYLVPSSSDWVAEWQEDALPAAIRVSLVLADPYRGDLQVSRKAVFPIYVR